jgi:hypothetical protein
LSITQNSLIRVAGIVGDWQFTATIAKALFVTTD